VIPVSLAVAGAGTLEAASSANPKDVYSFRQKRPGTFHGRCLAIVRPRNAAGHVTVQASAAALAPASVVIRVG
jgi:beta-galactosidase